jgi:primosomal protein N' (replication factor Y)
LRDPLALPDVHGVAEVRMFARVVVDLPLTEPLDYRAIDGAVAGACCVVPVGRRRASGVVVATGDSTAIDAARIRPMSSVFDVAPLAARWLELTRFAADYYQHGWGEVALTALPPLLRSPPGVRAAATLRRLRAAGAAAGPVEAGVPAQRFNDAQRAAVAALNAQTGFSASVLFGVTGSGKTAVYLEAIASRLAQDPAAQALLLVPEINLTPQLEARLRARFPAERVVCLHSALPAGERNAAWLAAHEGRARVVLGTRLAVFASLPRLALIVVDEEHDASFKAGDGVRYSARDLAVKRAQIEGVPVVLGSATPSLETWSHALAGRYRLLRMPERVGAGGPSPALRLIDVREFRPVLGLSPPLREALAAALARGEQSLVFINRRGYAPVIACEACGWTSRCPRCAAFAAFHKPDRSLRCHHCGWQTGVPRACPACGNPDLQAVGQGTQRIEEALRELLPGARITRIDRDSTQRRHAARNAFSAMHAGATDVLVGTQMIAKGHDFQGVTVVGVLNADAQLVSHDFRAAERLFSTLLQVAGRAGRAGQPSRVLLQTRYPAHPLFDALTRFDFEAFAQGQLAERRAAGMPPFVFHALLACEAREMDDALAFLRRARARGQEPDLASGTVRLFDPVPMTLAQRADVFRAQLLVESDRRAALQVFLRAWLAALRTFDRAGLRGTRWFIEVDPLDI